MTYRPLDKFICLTCLDDKTLGRLVGELITGQNCSYCNIREGVSTDIIQEHVLDAIEFRYQDPAHEVPYESREGGYQGNLRDGADLVWEVFDGASTREKDIFLVDLAESFTGSVWAKKDYFSLGTFDALQFGWKEFVTEIKHRTRYLFRDITHDATQSDPEVAAPSEMLEELATLIEDFELVQRLSPDTDIFRARIHSRRERFSTAAELGPPSRDDAIISNRMSPAGIPMFYGALDPRTAVLETFEPALSSRTSTIARFQSERPLLLVDLTQIPNIPSLFDEERRPFRDHIAFLHGFVRDVTKPIQRDGREHIEYVPTQVVTEYFRRIFRWYGEELIDGILYQSSRGEGDRSVVLFFTQLDCGPRAREHWEGPPTLLLSGYDRININRYLGRGTGCLGTQMFARAVSALTAKCNSLIRATFRT